VISQITGTMDTSRQVRLRLLFFDVQIVLLHAFSCPERVWPCPSRHIKRSAVQVFKEKSQKGLQMPSLKPTRLDPMYTGVVSRPCPDSQQGNYAWRRIKGMRPGTRLDAIQKKNASRTVLTT
jgi:hypothetical protein